MEEKDRMKFSDDIVKVLEEKFPGRDMYSMSLEELEVFKEEVIELRQQYSLLEAGAKLCGNAAYGASANKNFYFYNVNLAADITGECRILTKTMWNNLENFFHNTIWERKDLWEKFDFALDENKKEWFSNRTVSAYSDTDSCKCLSIIKLDKDNFKTERTIEQCWEDCYKETGMFDRSEKGNEVVTGNGRKVLNYVNGELKYVPIKYVMRHKVSKSQYEVVSESGKSINVTGDHSCMVIRDNNLISVKALEILDSDKLVVVNNNNILIEQVKQVNKLQDFDNEYVYDIEVEDNSHTFIANDILVHNSVYVTYGDFLDCFTDEYKAKYDTVEKKVKWILKFNQEFLDGQNTKWCEEIYNPRHGNNVHIFELETVNYAQLVLCKKRYLKAVSFNKGKFLDPPKISGTGIEIIKTTTPALCREILTDLTKSLLFEYPTMTKEEYVMYFSNKLKDWKKKFYSAEPEQISQSINVGALNKYVIDWQDNLIFGKQTPVSVKAAARYNHLAYKNGEGDKYISGGKIKYYNIKLSEKVTDYFGFPAGEYPSWAPPMDKTTQWQKTVIEPINRFLEVMDIPKMSVSNTIQYDLFGNVSFT